MVEIWSEYGHVLIENDERRETISQNMYAGSYTHLLPLPIPIHLFTTIIYQMSSPRTMNDRVL